MWVLEMIPRRHIIDRRLFKLDGGFLWPLSMCLQLQNASDAEVNVPHWGHDTKPLPDFFSASQLSCHASVLSAGLAGVAELSKKRHSLARCVCLTKGLERAPSPAAPGKLCIDSIFRTFGQRLRRLSRPGSPLAWRWETSFPLGRSRNPCVLQAPLRISTTVVTELLKCPRPCVQDVVCFDCNKGPRSRQAKWNPGGR